jgi:hypothetical protein
VVAQLLVVMLILRVAQELVQYLEREALEIRVEIPILEAHLEVAEMDRLPLRQQLIAVVVAVVLVLLVRLFREVVVLLEDM